MNQTGLQNIFKMISQSYSGDNFYPFPELTTTCYRSTTGCYRGLSLFGRRVCWQLLGEPRYWPRRYLACNERDNTKHAGHLWRPVVRELQWNNVPEQHELNRYIIQMHQEFGIDLISTADSHYYNETVWKDRELYRALAGLVAANQLSFR